MSLYGVPTGHTTQRTQLINRREIVGLYILSDLPSETSDVRE